jgi:hypothetical protein
MIEGVEAGCWYLRQSSDDRPYSLHQSSGDGAPHCLCHCHCHCHWPCPSRPPPDVTFPRGEEMVQMAMGEQLRESAMLAMGCFSNAPDPLMWLISENGLTTVASEAWQGPRSCRAGQKGNAAFQVIEDALQSLQRPAYNSTIEHKAQSTKHMHAAPPNRAPLAVLPATASTWSDPMDALLCNNTVPGMELGPWSPEDGLADRSVTLGSLTQAV